ncbi:MAG TPA: hypothetical protein DD426_13390, partial [Clostridiaceae bacterium]|nr:hypothetical protein [Clostridiaceae bacterium]
FLIFAVFMYSDNKTARTETLKETAPSSEETSKYDIYTGGENIDPVTIGGSDLFWGLKYDLRKYFAFIKNAHSGVVNDYSLWVVGTLVVLSVYLLFVL